MDAFAYYNAHKGSLPTPDSAWLEWGLDPGTPTPAKLEANEAAGKPMPFKLRSIDIPTGIPGFAAYKFLDSANSGKSRYGTAAKPIFKSAGKSMATPLGTVSWRVTHVQKGGKSRYYASVRPELLALLKAMPQSAIDMPRDEWERAATDEALANRFWTKILKETPQPSESEVKAALAKGRIPTEARTMFVRHGNSLSGARQWLFDERWRNPLSEWKAGLWLDKGALSL